MLASKVSQVLPREVRSTKLMSVPFGTPQSEGVAQSREGGDVK